MRACSQTGCGRPSRSRGLCSAHYFRFRNGIPMDKPIRARAPGRAAPADGLCSHPGCGRPHKQCGFCAKHENIRWRYGLTPAEYEALGNACRVCGSADDQVVDHDHACCPDKRSCGKCVRGLLCGPCNKAAGFLRDDPVRARALADYLEGSK